MLLPIVKTIRNIRLPTYASQGAAALDLCIYPAQEEDRIGGECDFQQEVVLHSGAPVPTRFSAGFACAIPDGYVGLICIRSGISTAGVYIPHAPGIIDSDYRGEIFFYLGLRGSHSYRMWYGTRVAQMLILPVTTVLLDERELLPSTARGTGGFGSTGL